MSPDNLNRAPWPDHVPPGNAAPRFINLRDGGNLNSQPRLMARISFYGAVFLLSVLTSITFA